MKYLLVSIFSRGRNSSYDLKKKSPEQEENTKSSFTPSKLVTGNKLPLNCSNDLRYKNLTTVELKKLKTKDYKKVEKVKEEQ